MDSHLRGNDGVMKIQSFYESINNGEKKRSTPTYNELRTSPALEFYFGPDRQCLLEFPALFGDLS